MMQTIWDRRQKAILDKETAMERNNLFAWVDLAGFL
jgi:hypothetical protein